MTLKYKLLSLKHRYLFVSGKSYRAKEPDFGALRFVIGSGRDDVTPWTHLTESWVICILVLAA